MTKYDECFETIREWGFHPEIDPDDPDKVLFPLGEALDLNMLARVFGIDLPFELVDD